MIPKCTGSTPTSIATGRKIGVVMTIRGAMSMKVPSASSMRLMISRVRIGLSVITPISAPIAAGTSSSASAKPKAVAAAMMNKTIAAVRTDFPAASHMPFHPRLR